MHHHTELSFGDEFRWVSPLHYLNKRMTERCSSLVHVESAAAIFTLLLRRHVHSCTVLPSVGHSSNHQYHCGQLTRQSAVVPTFIALLMFPFDAPSYI